jgi:hypothetical protein
MKKHVNGIYNPRIITVAPDGTRTGWDISFKFQNFSEYQEEFALSVRSYVGKKSKKPLWVDYEWELSFEDYAEGPDLQMVKEIINREIDGHQIIIVPSRVEYPWRRFFAQVKPEKRELSQYPSHRQYNGIPMKGYKITFENTDPMFYVDLADPNIAPVISSVTCEELMYVAP